MIRQIRDDSTNGSGITSAARCSTTKTITVFVKCYRENATSGSTLLDELRSSVFLYIFVAYIVFGVLTANVLVFSDTVSYQILGKSSIDFCPVLNRFPRLDIDFCTQATILINTERKECSDRSVGA